MGGISFVRARIWFCIGHFLSSQAILIGRILSLRFGLLLLLEEALLVLLDELSGRIAQWLEQAHWHYGQVQN